MRVLCQLTSALAIGAAMACGAAEAQGAWTGNVAATTDYVFRGLSQTNGNAAVQGGADYTDGGFYAGAWASSLDFGVDAAGANAAADLELDVYAGFRPVWGNVTFDLGVIGYLYPGSTDDFSEYDYWEGYAKASFSPVEGASLGVAAYYSPEFTTESGDAVYIEANGSWTLSDSFAISGAVGQQTVDTPIFAGEDQYVTWNVGGTLTAGGFSFDMRYVGTDVENLAIADDRAVFTVKRAM